LSKVRTSLSNSTHKRKWIKAVSTDLPAEKEREKKRYCGVCKSRMDMNEALDRWICRNEKCAATLVRGYGIGPTKDDLQLVTATDPYAEHNQPFVKAIDMFRKDKEKRPQDFHGLRRPVEEKKARSAAEAMQYWGEEH
jgi:hypothetical protein